MKTLQGLPHDSIDLWEGSIDSSTWEGSVQDSCARMISYNVDPGGCRSINIQPGKNLHEDFARNTSGRLMILGGFNQQSTWEGSMKTLQGLSQTVLILGGGGSIGSQLGIDLQRLCKNYLIQC